MLYVLTIRTNMYGKPVMQFGIYSFKLSLTLAAYNVAAYNQLTDSNPGCKNQSPRLTSIYMDVWIDTYKSPMSLFVSY